MVFCKVKYEEIKKIQGVPNLHKRAVVLEGTCLGVVCRAGFLGRRALYSGTLETTQGELVSFSGSGSSYSTDGDQEASLARLSEVKGIPARVTGHLESDKRFDDTKEHYMLILHGIKIGDITSCFYGDHCEKLW